MSGYYGFSMSNNALYAYENGEKPISKWTKSDIIQELTAAHPAEYIEEVKKLTASEVKALFLNRTAWHHTSRLFNQTDFYAVSLTVPFEAIRNTIANRKPKEAKPEDKPTKAKVIYSEWTGTRRHLKLIDTECYAVIIGRWAYLENGQKKRTDGKHFHIIETYETAPKGTAKTFKDIEKRI